MHTPNNAPPPNANKNDYTVGYFLSSDPCGPITPPFQNGKRHFLPFIDAASRYLIIYFLKDRREVRIIQPAPFAWLTAVRGTPPTLHRTDNAKEFCDTSAKHTNHMHEVPCMYGLEQRASTLHPPQENSRAERINLTLLNAARVDLHHAQKRPILGSRSQGCSIHIQHHATQLHRHLTVRKMASRTATDS